jgi:MSHA biogenesis protein MshK
MLLQKVKDLAASFVDSANNKACTVLVFVSVAFGVVTSVSADPMKPPGFGVSAGKASDKRASSYQVFQILHGEQRKIALVNGNWVSVGDSVAGARVVAINKDAVILTVAGKKQRIAVHKASGMEIVREADK